MSQRLALLFVLTLPGFSSADTSPEQFEQVPGLCVKAEQPEACMQSYGFECHSNRAYDKSLEAVIIGCNLHLPNGRAHFAQLLYDDGGWVVETQKTYEPEMSEIQSPTDDPELAMSNYVSGEMKAFSTYSSGATGSDQFSDTIFFETGIRRSNERVDVRALCAVIFESPLEEQVSTGTQAECERLLLRTIQRVGQPQTLDSYVVAGPSEIGWTSKTVTVASGNTALVLDGQYSFPHDFKSCQWVSGCCNTDGLMYLDSCRVPTDPELQAVKVCLARELPIRSEEYAACMREAGVRYGCEEQPDGSRICY